MDTILTAASRYIARGWPVFILGHSKRPVRNCDNCPSGDLTHDRETCPCLTCHGFYAATRDMERVTDMVAQVPDGLLAIRTGASSQLVVVDIDPDHGGRLYPEWMNPTYAIQTGSGGWHLYYQHPGIPISSRALSEVEGVDIKADGGYVVAPPSVHPRTGQSYSPANTRAIEEMAAALRNKLTTPRAVSPETPTQSHSSPHHTTTTGGAAISIHYPDKLLNTLIQRVLTAPQGRRRTTLYGAARGVARMVNTGLLTLNEAITALTDAGHSVEQTPKQTRDAINGAWKDEGLSPPIT